MKEQGRFIFTFGLLLFLLLFFLLKEFRIGTNPDAYFNNTVLFVLFFYTFSRIITFMQTIKDYHYLIKFIRGKVGETKDILYSLPAVILDLILLYLAVFKIHFDKKVVAFYGIGVVFLAVVFFVNVFIILRNRSR